MNNSTKGSKIFVKAVCMILIFSMFLSIFAFDIGVPENEAPVAMASASDYLTMMGKVSDFDTSNFQFISEFDAQSRSNYQFVNTTANNGRVWTDKSVSAMRAFIYDTLGGVVDAEWIDYDQPEEFLVTYSALSQNTTTQDVIVEPSDTVFVIDVSGSMATNTVPGDGRTRIAVVVDALNDAIGMLMGANDNNRIAVVVYGGQSVSGQNQAKVYTVLPLSRYNTSAPIFTMSGTSTVNVRSGIGALQSSFVAEGGTPTQLGLRRGAQILATNTDTTFNTGVEDPKNPGNPLIVKRQPNIILMTDGEPTYAWQNYRMNSFATFEGVTTTSNWYDVGNGSTGDMGLTALTVMTASYVKKLVRDNYYGTSLEYASRSVGFYNIGLGVNSAIANGLLDPYGVSASGVPNAQLVTQVGGSPSATYNMLDIINEFAPAASPPQPIKSFPAIARGASTSNPSRPLVSGVINDVGILTCNYNTMSFTAMDKAGLDDAFNSITQQIVNQGHYSTSVVGDPKFEGYLTFSDVLGEYMEFGSFRGLWYNNRKYTGGSFAGAMVPGPLRNSFLSTLVEQMTAQAPGNSTAFTLTTHATPLLESNLAASTFDTSKPSNVISYFTDLNRVYTGSAYNPDGSPVADPTTGARVDMYIVQNSDAVNSQNGNPSDLMYIIFQVVTALEDESFPITDNGGSTGPNLSPILKEGDQTVRWYIPAELLPLRNVETTGDPSNPAKDDFGNIIYQVTEQSPLQTIYTVRPKKDVIAGKPGLTAEYMKVNKAPGQNSYYFYANRWRGTNGGISRNDMANMSLSFFIPDDLNPYYFPQPDTMGGIPKLPIPVGPTGTSPFTWDYRNFTMNPTVEVQRLGNNGRLLIRAQVPLSLYKTFNFDTLTTPPAPAGLSVDDIINDTGRISMISFTIVGFDNVSGPPPVEIFRKTVFLNEFTWNATLQRFELNDILVPPGTYTFIETGGTVLGTLLAKSMPLGGRYPDPLFDQTVNVVAFANAYTNGDIPNSGIYLQKVFHGLRPSEIPTSYTIELWYDDLNGHEEIVDTFGPADFIVPPATPYGIYIEFLADGTTYLPPGRYYIKETGVDVPPYILTTNPSPLEYILTDDDLSAGFMFTANNIYTLPSYDLTLRKLVNPSSLPIETIDDFGNTIITNQVPNDLAFKVEQKDKPTWTSSDPWNTVALYTVNYSDLVNGSYTITGLPTFPTNAYTITEIGGDVPGYNGPQVTISPTLAANPERPVIPFSYLLPLNTSITVSFTNTYTTPPPPPPDKSPQTGVNWEIALPITLLSVSAILFGGAEFFRRRYKKRNRD